MGCNFLAWLPLLRQGDQHHPMSAGRKPNASSRCVCERSKRRWESRSQRFKSLTMRALGIEGQAATRTSAKDNVTHWSRDGTGHEVAECRAPGSRGAVGMGRGGGDKGGRRLWDGRLGSGWKDVGVESSGQCYRERWLLPIGGQNQHPCGGLRCSGRPRWIQAGTA